MEATEEKIKKSNKGLTVVLIIIVIFLGIVTIANWGSKTQTNTDTSNTAPTDEPTATDTPTPTDEPTATLAPTLSAQQIIAKFESEGQHVTVADIYKSPNSYKGKSLIFTCSVAGFPKDENGDVGGLNCDD